MNETRTDLSPLLQLLQHWREEASKRRPDGLYANSERTIATYRKCADQLEAVISTLHQEEA